MATMKQRMLAGELYLADDVETHADYAACQRRLEAYNATPATDRGDTRRALLRELFDAVGDQVEVRPPFVCEFGRVRIGAGSFVNVGCVMLDSAPIEIGEACQLAPNVQLTTATHPLDPVARRTGWESAHPIVLEDNVWLGAGVIVGPGVRIGKDSVVGAVSVVLDDLPAGVLAVGTPARVLRPLGPQDTVKPAAR